MNVLKCTKGFYVIVETAGHATLVDVWNFSRAFSSVREAMNFADREQGMVLSWA